MGCKQKQKTQTMCKKPTLFWSKSVTPLHPPTASQWVAVRTTTDACRRTSWSNSWVEKGWPRQGEPEPPNFWSNKCVLNKRIIKVCISRSKLCPGISGARTEHLEVTLILRTFGCNARGRGKGRCVISKTLHGSETEAREECEESSVS